MKKYKTTQFYVLDNGDRYAIAIDMEKGISKLIGENKKVLKEVKYDKINELICLLESIENDSKK